MLKAPESKFRYDRDIEFEDAPAPRRRGGFAAKYDDPQPDIDALLSVVGSKRARDIVRKNRFMSKAAFDEWNDKTTGGRGKYWGDYVDIDEDGMHEFVVRRGGQDGRLVAVNGYTTKASDWAVRKPYYDQYPKIGERPEHGLRGFVKNELLKEEVDEYGYPTEAYAKRIADFHQQYPKYAIRVSSNVSPYNLFVRNIASGALATKINEMGWDDDERKTFMKEMENHYGKGWILKLSAYLWHLWVKQPILDKMQNEGKLEGWKTKYNTTHERNANSAPSQFNKWLFAKKPMQRIIREYTKDMLNSEGETFSEAMDAFVDAIDQLVVEALGEDNVSPSNSPSKQRYLARYAEEPKEEPEEPAKPKKAIKKPKK